jgi:hypothetical protein
MGVFFGISISMVHPVHDCIGAGTQIRRALCQVSKNIKSSFPEFIHGECLVSGIPVLKKGLTKKRRIPDYNKNDQHPHSFHF